MCEGRREASLAQHLKERSAALITVMPFGGFLAAPLKHKSKRTSIRKKCVQIQVVLFTSRNSTTTLSSQSLAPREREELDAKRTAPLSLPECVGFASVSQHEVPNALRTFN